MRVNFWLCLFFFVLSSPLRADQTLRVAAAANLQQVFTEALIPAFQKQTGIQVVPTFGSTKLLATQLEHGAPDDVFVSADTATIDQLTTEKLIVPQTAQVYAIGQLVMWTLHNAPHHPKRLQDLADPAYAKIAIANPALAPYGLAAQQAFAKAGLTEKVTPRVVQAENIGQALQYARSGNADVALTALSLVIQDKDDPYVIVPEKLHQPIAQSLGLVQSSTQPELARRFITFLTSKSTASIWKRYGYILPRRKTQ